MACHSKSTAVIRLPRAWWVLLGVAIKPKSNNTDHTEAKPKADQAFGLTLPPVTIISTTVVSVTNAPVFHQD